MRRLIVLAALLVMLFWSISAVPATAIVINNGLAPPNPANVSA